MFMFLDAYLGYNNQSLDAPAGNYVSPMVALTAPFSRGNITIASTDTNDNPILSPNWLLDPRDQEVVVAAFKRARQVMTQKAIASVVGAEAFPGTNVSRDADILKLAQKQAFSSYHGSCTCAMGLKSDKMAVLDSKARVYGVSGLRVVDASSFPVLPPGTPSHTVFSLYLNVTFVTGVMQDKFMTSKEACKANVQHGHGVTVTTLTQRYDSDHDPE
ncbi:hypothetical protein N0V90_002089 [Kalmusia sp. IMI 367209]|nr:hypothetical protein N0V90_002089 [Kalmusia sp. IMI 367209]